VGVIYRLSILVLADVSQPIQKIIGIGYLMSTDTNNLIFWYRLHYASRYE
jgi:hypothetical protein